MRLKNKKQIEIYLPIRVKSFIIGGESMSKITGKGSVFLNVVVDTKKLLYWYHEVLGLDITEVWEK